MKHCKRIQSGQDFNHVDIPTETRCCDSHQKFGDCKNTYKQRRYRRCQKFDIVAKDVATCIEHKDVTTMCRVCRDRDMAVINGKEYSADLAEYSESRGNPNLTVISESGLYRIFAKCNLPKCEPFESWVVHEVLPTIRKTVGSSNPKSLINLLKRKELDSKTFTNDEIILGNFKGNDSLPLANRGNTFVSLRCVLEILSKTELSSDIVDNLQEDLAWIFRLKRAQLRRHRPVNYLDIVWNQLT